MVKRKGARALLGVGILSGAVLLAALIGPAGTTAVDEQGGQSVRGAGTTMVQGRTGSPEFKPVITKVAFHWQAGGGHFECLALAPSENAGKPGSGTFDTNVMYVTGAISFADTSAASWCFVAQPRSPARERARTDPSPRPSRPEARGRRSSSRSRA